MSKSNFQHQQITVFHWNATQPLPFNVNGHNISAAECAFSFKNDEDPGVNSFMYAHSEQSIITYPIKESLGNFTVVHLLHI